MSRNPDNLRTARLILRRWRAEDREPLAALNSDPEVMRYFPAILDRSTSDAMIEHFELRFLIYGYSLWAVEVAATEQLIGFTGLSEVQFEAPFTPAVEVGWRLARSAWGHGYATEAARAAMTFGFEQAGLTEIVSVTATTNTRSQAVMRRLGMTHADEDDFDHPRHEPGHPLRRHVVYRMPRHRWPAPPAPSKNQEPLA